MTDADNARQNLTAAKTNYRRTEDAHTKARNELQEAVVAALRAGVGPSEAARLSGFTDAYVRKLARAAGLPPLRESRGGAAPRRPKA
ncbi:hypothetical protein ACFFX1_55675 [Dactylosporangium sucinum]|uniref:hypothetical protein n=1 Tax=Dactylosporangium sucinum TaxID=1424081 RepID=UPI00167DDB22|nr:hypothetical protein [Dactylosporangium sucinum]